MSNDDADTQDSYGGAFVLGVICASVCAYGILDLVPLEHQRTVFAFMLAFGGGLVFMLVFWVYNLRQDAKRLREVESYLKSLNYLVDFDAAIGAELTRTATQYAAKSELFAMVDVTNPTDRKRVVEDVLGDMKNVEIRFYARYDEHRRFAKLTGVTLHERDIKHYLPPAEPPQKTGTDG